MDYRTVLQRYPSEKSSVWVIRTYRSSTFEELVVREVSCSLGMHQSITSGARSYRLPAYLLMKCFATACTP